MPQPGPVHARGSGGASSVAPLVEALRRGELVVLPTETVYGLAAWIGAPDRTDAPGPWARLTAARGALAGASGPVDGPSTWHVDSVETLARAVGPCSPLHARAMARLLPGPVTLRIDAGPERLARARAASGATGPGIIDDGHRIDARVADHATARAVAVALAGSPGALVAEGIRAAGPGGQPLAQCGPALERLREAGVSIGAWLDEGPTRLARPSALVALGRDGGLSLVRAGGQLDDEAAMSRLLARNILFVCTGNTCRSPMAEMIARHLLAKRAAILGPGGVPTTVASAGVAATGGTGGDDDAGDGEPYSPQNAQALLSIGIDPRPTAAGAGSPGRGRSRAVTAAMVRRADVVFVMTGSQRDALLRLAPDAADHVRLLDSAGDVPDPFGGPVALYTSLARRLLPMIQRRLDALDEPSTTGAEP